MLGLELICKSALYLPPATQLRQGNVFTPVCDSVHRGGSVQEGGLCPGGSLPGRPPAAVQLRTGGTHPTGMHSCFHDVNYMQKTGKKLEYNQYKSTSNVNLVRTFLTEIQVDSHGNHLVTLISKL